MPNKVSAEVAAVIAATYPQHASIAAEATLGDLVVTEDTVVFVNTAGVLDKKRVVLSRQRKVQLPTGQIVAIDEPAAVVPLLTPEPKPEPKPEPPQQPETDISPLRRAVRNLTKADK